MTKNGRIGHLTCRKHGARGLLLAEPKKKGICHDMEVRCLICDPAGEWIGWCNFRQAQNIIDVYGDLIRVKPRDEPVPAAPPAQTIHVTAAHPQPLQTRARVAHASQAQAVQTQEGETLPALLPPLPPHRPRRRI
jgi:hypothetical protein